MKLIVNKANLLLTKAKEIMVEEFNQKIAKSVEVATNKAEAKNKQLIDNLTEGKCSI